MSTRPCKLFALAGHSCWRMVSFCALAYCRFKDRPGLGWGWIRKQPTTLPPSTMPSCGFIEMELLQMV